MKTNGPNQVYPLDGFVPEGSPAQMYRLQMVACQVAGARFLTSTGQPNLVALQRYETVQLPPSVDTAPAPQAVAPGDAAAG